jgi:hypothetical protein
MEHNFTSCISLILMSPSAVTVVMCISILSMIKAMNTEIVEVMKLAGCSPTEEQHSRQDVREQQGAEREDDLGVDNIGGDVTSPNS